MASRGLTAQAAQLDDLMPRLMRCLLALSPHDPTTELPVAQLRVCSILRDGSHTISALARELCISVSAATPIADRLESAGIVERIAGTRDRRMRNLRLTDYGAQIMRARRQRRVRRAAALLAELTPARRAAVLRALQELLRAGDAKASEATVAVPTSAELDGSGA